MDSDQPERVLDRITDDFVMSIQFSKGEGQSAEFVGDRAGLEGYLEQREKSVLVHHVTHGARVGDVELVLGRTTRDGDVRGVVQRLRPARPGDRPVPAAAHRAYAAAGVPSVAVPRPGPGSPSRR